MGEKTQCINFGKEITGEFYFENNKLNTRLCLMQIKSFVNIDEHLFLPISPEKQPTAKGKFKGG